MLRTIFIKYGIKLPCVGSCDAAEYSRWAKSHILRAKESADLILSSATQPNRLPLHTNMLECQTGNA